MIRRALFIFVLIASPLAIGQELASVSTPETQSLVSPDEPSFFSPKTESDVAAMASLQLEDLKSDSTEQ